MVSTTNITLDSTTRIETIVHPGSPVWVEVAAPGHALALHATNADDLERLAADLITAANAMRAARAWAA